MNGALKTISVFFCVVEAFARGKQPVAVIQVRQLSVNVICLAEAQIEWTGRAAHADISDLQVRENIPYRRNVPLSLS